MGRFVIILWCAGLDILNSQKYDFYIEVFVSFLQRLVINFEFLPPPPHSASVCQYTLARLVARSATLAGSSFAWNTAFSQMD